MKNKIICIIPARYGSERLQGKVLYNLNGKTILERVYNRAKLIKSFSAIYVATDNKKIAEEAQRFGAEVIMTSEKCSSGSDRVAEAAKSMDASIIVNIQADEPFLPAEAVEKPLKLMLDNPSLYVTTAVTRIRKQEELYDPNIAKIVIDSNNYTLYSSRSLIPYPTVYFTGNNPADLQKVVFYKHIGVYLFRKKFLAQFAKMPVSSLERAERLEQLRIIENGYRLKVAIVKKDSPCVDTLEDIKRLAEK